MGQKNPNTARHPRTDPWQSLLRPMLTRRAAMILAWGSPVLAVAMIGLDWATDHQSLSSVLFFAVFGISGPAVVLGRYLATGRFDALPQRER